MLRLREAVDGGFVGSIAAVKIEFDLALGDIEDERAERSVVVYPVALSPGAAGFFFCSRPAGLGFCLPKLWGSACRS
jgi:hypothetical protein